MSTLIKPVTPSQHLPNFSAEDDGPSFDDYSAQAQGLDLGRVLLHGGEPLASASDSAAIAGIRPLLEAVAEHGRERGKIVSDIAHLNAGHSDPTLIAVDIREINQKLGEVSLVQQVAMKVEQAGAGAVKQLISAQ